MKHAIKLLLPERNTDFHFLSGVISLTRRQWELWSGRNGITFAFYVHNHVFNPAAVYWTECVGSYFTKNRLL